MTYLRESAIVNRLFPDQEDPQKRLEFQEAETRLEKAVARLPEKQRAVFVLRYYEEMPYEEIALVLKTSVGGLKANFFHALKKVQEFMKDETATGGHEAH
jgi:RNA polymerase sigma-70 factor (ECF subfamily)